MGKQARLKLQPTAYLANLLLTKGERAASSEYSKLHFIDDLVVGE